MRLWRRRLAHAYRRSCMLRRPCGTDRSEILGTGSPKKVNSMTQRGMRADHHRSKGRQHLLPHRLIKELRVRLLGRPGIPVAAWEEWPVPLIGGRRPHLPPDPRRRWQAKEPRQARARPAEKPHDHPPVIGLEVVREKSLVFGFRSQSLTFGAGAGGMTGSIALRTGRPSSKRSP